MFNIGKLKNIFKGWSLKYKKGKIIFYSPIVRANFTLDDLISLYHRGKNEFLEKTGFPLTPEIIAILKALEEKKKKRGKGIPTIAIIGGVGGGLALLMIMTLMMMQRRRSPTVI